MAAGMCRAHGIAHQRVVDRQGLQKALQAAWALNTHSVVEVSVDRDSNVEQHRSIQAAVKAAVLRALHTVTSQAEGDVLSKLHSSVTCGSTIRQMLLILGQLLNVFSAGCRQGIPAVGFMVATKVPGSIWLPVRPPLNVMRCPSCAGGCLQGHDLLPAQALKVDRASYQAYALPLKRGLTTGSTASTRPGFLLHLTCSALDGSEAQGVGEVAPLAGLQPAVALVCASPVEMLSGCALSSHTWHTFEAALSCCTLPLMQCTCYCRAAQGEPA